MTKLPNYLVPQEGNKTILEKSEQDLFHAHQVAMGCARTLIVQPSFSISLLDTLPEDQALAAQHASTFKGGWGFGVTNTFISGLTSICEFTIAICKSGLKPIASKLDAKDPSSDGYAGELSSFRTYISTIISTCCDIDADSGSTLLRMKEMHDKLAELSGDIENDETRLHAAIKAIKNSDEIEVLETKQRSLQKQLADVNAEIAKGATTTIASDIEFGFKFGSAFLDGVTTGAVINSALSVVGEVDAIKQFDEKTKALRDKQTELGKKISNLAKMIAEDKAELMELTLVTAQIGEFDTRIKDILAFTGSIVDQMTAWQKQLELFSDYSRPLQPNFYSDQVSAGITYWSTLKKQLIRYSKIMA